MVLNADEVCVCKANYYQSTDSGDTECKLCPNGTTTETNINVTSIHGCGVQIKLITSIFFIIMIFHRLLFPYYLCIPLK